MNKVSLPTVPPSPEELEIPLSSDWFRVPRAIQYSGLPRATLYAAMADPESGIISFNLKLRNRRRKATNAKNNRNWRKSTGQREAWRQAYVRPRLSLEEAQARLEPPSPKVLAFDYAPSLGRDQSERSRLEAFTNGLLSEMAASAEASLKGPAAVAR